MRRNRPDDHASTHRSGVGVSAEDTNNRTGNSGHRRNHGPGGSDSDSDGDDDNVGFDANGTSHNAEDNAAPAAKRIRLENSIEKNKAYGTDYKSADNGKGKGTANWRRGGNAQEADEHGRKEASGKPENEEDEENEEDDSATVNEADAAAKAVRKTVLATETNAKLRESLRDEAGYLRGSVMRVTLRNFMSHGASTFCLGPRFNLILGPNGTGKSTLVCALAAVFNSPLNVVGRATEVYDLVSDKSDDPEAEIAVELAMGRDASPCVLRRTINRATRSSRFFIDNKLVKKEMVTTFASELLINAKSTCQFMPQEKVASLAKLSPSGLLLELQSIVDPTGKLLDLHKRLCKMDSKPSTYADNIGYLLAQLKREIQLNAAIEPQYKSMQIRAKLQRRLLFLRAALTQLNYNWVKRYFEAANMSSKKLRSRLAALSKDNLPHEQKVNAAREAQSKAEMEFKMLLNDISSCYGKMSTYSRNLLDSESRLNDLESKGNEIRADISSAKKHLDTAKSELAAATEEYEREYNSRDSNRVAEEQNIRSRIQELSASIAGIEEFENELNEKVSYLSSEREKLNGMLGLAFNAVRRRKEDAENQSRNFENQKVSVLRGHELGRIGLSALSRIKQARDNGTLSGGKIYGPMLLHFDVKVPDYLPVSELVKKLGSYSNLTAYLALRLREVLKDNTLNNLFMTEAKSDYDTLVSMFVETRNPSEKLHVSLRAASANGPKHMPRFSDRRILKDQFGFDGYLIDLIDADEVVKTWMCNEFNLNRIPFAIDHVNLDEVEKYPNDFIRYIAKDTKFEYKCKNPGSSLAQRDSFYLSSAISTQLSPLWIVATDAANAAASSSRNVGNFSNQEFADEVRKEEAEVAKLEFQLKEVEDARLKTVTEVREVRNNRKTLVDQRDDLASKVIEIDRKREKFAGAQRSVSDAERELQELTGTLDTHEAAISKAYLTAGCMNTAEINVEAKRFLAAIKETNKAVLKSAWYEENTASAKRAFLKVEQQQVEIKSYLSRVQQACNEHLANSKELQKAFFGYRSSISACKASNDIAFTPESFKRELEEILKESEQKHLANLAQEFENKFRSKAVQETQDPVFLGILASELTEHVEQLTNLNKQKHAVESEILCVEEQLKTTSGDDRVVEHYEDRALRIKELEKEIEVRRKKQQHMQERYKKMGSVWLKNINQIVHTVSSAFSEYLGRIGGCLGEIVLCNTTAPATSSHSATSGQKVVRAEAADAGNGGYANYGIEIKVKFSSSQELTALAKQRQSGGERGVSTMLFMLALQKISQVPFVLVDEINQGMDVVNERKIYQLVQEQVRANGAPQTILITPKLLPNLQYFPGCSVLFVLNGSGVKVPHTLSVSSGTSFR